MVKDTGAVVYFHNGKPYSVCRFGEEVWSHIRHWGKRGACARRADFEAQKAWWENAAHASVRLVS